MYVELYILYMSAGRITSREVHSKEFKFERRLL